MPVMDPFEGAKSERDESGRLLLKTIAQSGQAGKEAYDAARKETGLMRQNALDRATQRAQLTGQNLAGEDTAAVGEAADRYNTYFTGEEAAMQGRLGEIGASGQSYLAKVGQIAPFMQQKAIQQAAERENLFKTQVAANQAQIDADKAAEDRAHQRQIELLGLKNQFDVQADARARAAEEGGSGGLSKAATKLVSGPKASPIYQGMDTGNITRSPVTGVDPATGRIGVVGSEPLAPLGGQMPPPMDRNWIMANVVMPGTDKKATGSRADDVLRAPEVGLAVEFIEDLGKAKMTRGAIDDPVLFGNEYRGLSPRKAFEKWIDSQPGIRTMKAALKQYYGQYLDSLEK